MLWRSKLVSLSKMFWVGSTLDFLVFLDLGLIPWLHQTVFSFAVYLIDAPVLGDMQG